MFTRLLTGGLLASTAVFYMMPDDTGGSSPPADAVSAGAPSTPASGSDPVASTPPSTPDATGSAAPTTTAAPDPATAANAGQAPMISALPERSEQKISILRLVMAYFDPPFDGETEAGALVVKVNLDGTVNLKVFNPSGGEDRFVTGVRPRPYVQAMADGADKNAAKATMWDWPART